MNWLACLIDDPSGATAIEYAVIVSVIGLALAAALPDIGANIRTLLPAGVSLPRRTERCDVLDWLILSHRTRGAACVGTTARRQVSTRSQMSENATHISCHIAISERITATTRPQRAR